jgi:predicted porin
VAPTPLINAADKDIRTHVSAYANLGSKAKLGVGWLNRRVDTASAALADVRSNLFFVAASYFVTPAFIVDGEVYHITNSDHDTRATMGTLRTTYLLSKRTAVYAQGSYLANSAKARYSVSGGGGGTTPSAGTGQTGVMLGIRHSF